MTWLLLVLGLLLMALGTAFLYSGFGLIEIERGAAQVSAGASMLAGGAVTLGLSVILLQIQDSLAHLAGHAPAEAHAAESEKHVNLPVMAAGGMAGAGAAVAAGIAGLSTLAGHEPEAGKTTEDAAGPEPDKTIDPQPEAMHDEKPAEPVAPGIAAKPAAEPERDAPLHDDAPSALPPALDTPHTPLAEAEPAPAADQAADDWFERMFAETATVPALTAEAKASEAPHAPEPAPVNVAPVKAVEVIHAPPPEPAAHHEPEPPAALPQAEPLVVHHVETPHPGAEVVARHEADGITYTMYADGSIEANDGITARRFASMDELAASIQG
ncbi:MAG: hypothetical protein KGQ37_04940 [Hyphomicrobiales bacterium]|nr:hypothetical protein [Hyphomicrobiales bacterium]